MILQKYSNYRISQELLREKLNLPKEAIVIGAEFDAKHRTVILYLAGDKDGYFVAEAGIAPDKQ